MHLHGRLFARQLALALTFSPSEPFLPSSALKDLPVNFRFGAGAILRNWSGQHVLG